MLYCYTQHCRQEVLSVWRPLEKLTSRVCDLHVFISIEHTIKTEQWGVNIQPAGGLHSRRQVGSWPVRQGRPTPASSSMPDKHGLSARRQHVVHVALWPHGEVTLQGPTDQLLDLSFVKPGQRTGELPWSWGSWWRCCCSPDSGPSVWGGWVRAGSPWRWAPADESGRHQSSARCRHQSAPPSPVRDTFRGDLQHGWPRNQEVYQ